MSDKIQPKKYLEKKVQKKPNDKYSRITLSFKPTDEERLLFIYLSEKSRFAPATSIIKSLIYDQMVREGWDQKDSEYYEKKMLEYFPPDEEEVNKLKQMELEEVEKL